MPPAGAQVAVPQPIGAASWGDRLVAALTSTPFLGVLLAILSWPPRSITPATGPDASWVAGLYMGLERGLQFGQEVVFTYGPLGFLEEPVLYDQRLWVVATLYQGFIHVALAISLLWVGRRALGLPAGLAACYVVLIASGLKGAVLLLALIWSLVALGNRPPRFAVPLVVFGGGAIGAIELLGKANFGVGVLAIGVVTLLGLPGRRRNLPVFAATAASCLAFLWLLAGQDVSALPAFFANGAEVLSGYSNAMAVDISDASGDLPLAIVAIGLPLVAASAAVHRHSPARGLASVAAVAVFGYLTFKQGFVRQGLGNTPEFFVLACGAGIAVALRLVTSPIRAPRAAAAGLVLPLAAIALSALPTPSVWRALKPDDHLTYFRGELETLTHPGERDRIMASGRERMRSVYALGPGLRRLIGRRPVHVGPWQIGAAWAYGLNWDPLPVFQDYAAYTPALDHLNAADLEGAAAPALILRHDAGGSGGDDAEIDGRYSGWDPPAASVAMLCNYRPVAATAGWQLVEHTPDRCGPERMIETVETRTGEPVPVPKVRDRDELIVARIDGLDVEGTERIRSALYRARTRTVTLSSGASWRIPPETAGDGLLMSAPPGRDFPHPFELAPDTRSIVANVDGVERTITVSFRVRRLSAPRELRSRVSTDGAGAPINAGWR